MNMVGLNNLQKKLEIGWGKGGGKGTTSREQYRVWEWMLAPSKVIQLEWRHSYLSIKYDAPGLLPSTQDSD